MFGNSYSNIEYKNRLEDSEYEIYTKIHKERKEKGQKGYFIVLIFILVILFFAAIGIHFLLITNDTMYILPKNSYIALTKVIGMVLVIIDVIVLLKAYKTYDRGILPILVLPDDYCWLEKLQVRDGEIGYQPKSGAWIKLNKMEIIREDDEMIEVKCFYKNITMNLNFIDKNFIAKEDPIYPEILEQIPITKRKQNSYQKNVIILVVCFIIYVITIALGIYFSNSDKMQTKFPDNKIIQEQIHKNQEKVNQINVNEIIKNVLNN